MMVQLIVDSLWQGALVVVFAALVTVMLPKRSAATRYAVWFVALLALPIVPILTLWHPAPTPAIALPAADGMTMATALFTAKAAHAGTTIAIVWLCGFAFSLTRLAISYARIRTIVRRATAVPKLGNDVLLSNEVTIPIAVGVVSPRIVMPADLVQTLDPVDLEIILRHERAHIRRGDVAGNFVQRLIESALFFNPWVFIVGRQLIVEREAACDDRAIYSTNYSNRYATCLAQLACGVRRSRTPLLTPSAIGPRHLIVDRIARLLNGKVPQVRINYFVLGASAALFIALGLALGTPRVVSATTSTAGTKCNHPASVVTPAVPAIPTSFHANGYATALVSLDQNGNVLGVKIAHSSGYAVLDNATRTAALKSTYAPAVKQCKPVAGQYLFKVKARP